MSSEVVNKINEALHLMSSQSTEKVSALKYLESFQKTPEAWEVVHLIMSSDSPIDLKIFAAQTLRNKLTYDLHQLGNDINALTQLKDSLIRFLIQYNQPNLKIIRTQLSIALAKLSLQFLSWPNAVEEIVNKLSSDDNASTLLEFLKILPEESLDPKGNPLTDEEFQHRTEELIVEHVEKILLLLSQFSENSKNSTSDALILDCLNSWIKEIPVEKLLTINSITTLIFKSFNGEESLEKATECLISIIRETKDIDNLQLIYALYEQLIQLNPLLEKAKSEEDTDTFDSLTRLFVEAGEIWYVVISKNPKQFKKLVEILLSCTSFNEDLDIVKYTFYFWYNLKQMIVLDRFKEARLEFIPIYTQLIHIMISHLHYPDGSESTQVFSSKEEEDKFKEFRYDMGDVLKDCTSVIGSSEALAIPFEKIKIALNSSNKWQDVEAPLFSLRTMAREVSLKENTILPQIMNLLVQLPENIKIRYAATLVLGRYTEWTSKHPDFLEKQLNYIISGFQIQPVNSEIITAASHALMYFCHDCSKLLTNYIEQLYDFYLNVFQSFSSQQSKIDITSLYEITEGISHIIDTQKPDRISQITSTFIKPILKKLTSYVDQQPIDQVHTSIAEEIEILRIYFEFIRPRSFHSLKDPVSDLILEIWPVIIQLFEKHGSSIKVSERLMKFTKTIIQSYNYFLNPILPSIANTLVQGFQTTKYGCYLWVSGVVIKEFSGFDDYAPSSINDAANIKESVWNFACQQITTFIQIFKSQHDIINIPDLIEDFFRMMNDITMFYTPEFILSNLLDDVMEISILATQIEKFEPLISNLHFLIDLMSWGFDTPPISLYDDTTSLPLDDIKFRILKLINDKGGLLIKAILNGLIFKFHVDTHTDSFDLLSKLLRLNANNQELSISWLNEALNSLPQGTVSEQERKKLINTIGTSLKSKDFRRIRMSLKDFVNWYSRKNVSSRLG